jgi:hypothetical protein
MKDIETILDRLSRLSFRSRFRLEGKELEQLKAKGIESIMNEARGFIKTRLAPAHPRNDGKQTPWRNHPVFVAQHATATCCRKCIAKWHDIRKGHELTGEEQNYIAEVIRRWLSLEES